MYEMKLNTKFFFTIFCNYHYNVLAFLFV